MRIPRLLLFVSLVAGAAVPAQADDDWKKRSCDVAGMNFPVVDFHAHTFNFRHLPLRGILYGWGVPDFVAAVAADILWGITGSIDASPDSFADLRSGLSANAAAMDFRSRLTASGVDLATAIPDALEPGERQRFEEELNAYLLAELEYERSDPAAAVDPRSRPLTNFFRDLTASDPESAFQAPLSAISASDPAFRSALAALSLPDRLVALLVKPFELVQTVQGAYRFVATMVQAEGQLAEQLIAENCGTDYFIHYMMDLEPVYDDAPPVSFAQQHELAERVRQLTGNRLITFSAFVPFRFDNHELGMQELALQSGAVGVKYYPPSGYSASVRSIPGKPSRFRGIIYQGGARKQWQHRYEPLSERRVQQNWGVTVKDPRRAREETLEGVSGKFLAFAVERELPVFSHQTPGGFQAYRGYGETFAEPCDWLPVLQSAPDMRLVLGHSGGSAWYGSDSEFSGSFAEQALNLCTNFENVYCDFGYHERVLTDPGKAALRGRLSGLLGHAGTTRGNAGELDPATCRSGAAPVKFSIFDKLLYGSDWMMVVREPGYRDLPAAFAEVFSGELAQCRERFFGGNAIRLLRGSGGADRLPEPLRLASLPASGDSQCR